ncbi:MAG: hypothetical protein Q4E12_02200 [Coriobacteriia bacterium]|nr:hypothetical protein [Coriobacteriia bacterium]
MIHQERIFAGSVGEIKGRSTADAVHVNSDEWAISKEEEKASAEKNWKNRPKK